LRISLVKPGAYLSESYRKAELVGSIIDDRGDAEVVNDGGSPFPNLPRWFWEQITFKDLRPRPSQVERDPILVAHPPILLERGHGCDDNTALLRD
jgi:hypothetical protein